MGSIGCWEGKVKLCYSEVLHTYWLSGRARWENKRLKIITYGPIPARFVHCDREPNIFLFGLTKLSQETFHYTSTNCWKFWKFCFQPKRAQWTGTQENLKRILQIWKLFLCFFKPEKETFPLNFCNKDVSAGPQGFTQTGSGQPVSYTCQLSLWFSMDCTQGALWVIC